MSVGLGTIFGLSSDAIMIVFSTALAILVLWQDRARRSTQFFALCMIVFALHGMVHMAWQVPQRFDLDPEPILYLSTTTYLAGIIMLFNFVLLFAELDRHDQIVIMGTTIGATAAFITFIWQGWIYQNFEALANGSYRYEFTLLGKVGVGVLMGLLVANVALLFKKRDPIARRLALALIVILIGASVNAQASALREVPLNSLAITLAVLLLGHTVLKIRVYQPLIEVIDELARTIDELDRTMKRKTEFLATMSHELRTPLNSIIGYAELVVSRTYGDLTPVQEDRLEKVARNGHLLLELINDVLDLSRIEAGRLDLRPDRVSTVKLLNDLIAEHEPDAREKGLVMMPSFGHLPALLVDPDRARQILRNLVSNAIKFTDQGLIIVRGYYDLRRHQVVISVTDTGPGIAPEKHETLFSMYNMPEGTLTRQHEGTGLGLALAYQLTAMHGGKLWFESELGKGTTFHVALPAFDDSLEVRQPVEPRTRGDGPVVLAIDDDREAIELLQDQIESVGYRVHGAMTSNDGLQLAHELDPALITLDIAMPDLNGWHVLDTLRGDPATASIPVLVITAFDAEPENIVRADGFLTKPVQPGVLLEHIQALTGQPHPNERRRLTPPIRRRHERETV